MKDATKNRNGDNSSPLPTMPPNTACGQKPTNNTSQQSGPRKDGLVDTKGRQWTEGNVTGKDSRIDNM